MTRLLLAGCLLALAACPSSSTALEVVFSPADGGSCSAATDLSCVNYVQFTLETADEFRTHCIRVDQALSDLCQLRALADGAGLFTVEKDAKVRIELKGMRVFPATTCDVQAACPPRVIFSGASEEVKVGDRAGGSISIEVALAQPCGSPEQFFFRGAGQTCDSVCASGSVVCDGVLNGCLCRGVVNAVAGADGGL